MSSSLTSDIRPSVRNNYKRCGHYVDQVRLFPFLLLPLEVLALTTYLQPDEMVRVLAT